MGHSFSSNLYHVIFAAKGRRPLIKPEFQSRLCEYMGGVAREEFGRALAIGGTENHIHGLIVVRPDVAIAQALRKWKSLSSGWVHQTFTGSQDFGWQAGYGSFSVSESSKAAVAAYIARQQEHHKVMSFEEEFVKFLERHQVPYDPRYLWPVE